MTDAEKIMEENTMMFNAYADRATGVAIQIAAHIEAIQNLLNELIAASPDMEE